MNPHASLSSVRRLYIAKIYNLALIGAVPPSDGTIHVFTQFYPSYPIYPVTILTILELICYGPAIEKSIFEKSSKEPGSIQ